MYFNEFINCSKLILLESIYIHVLTQYIILIYIDKKIMYQYIDF